MNGKAGVEMVCRLSGDGVSEGLFGLTLICATPPRCDMWHHSVCMLHKPPELLRDIHQQWFRVSHKGNNGLQA